MNNHPSPLKAVALGLNDKTRTTLEMVLKGPGGGRWQLADDEAAQVAILDGDAIDALTLYDRQRRLHPGRPLVVISVRQPQLQDILLVPKPVRVEALLAALDQAHSRCQSPASGAAPEPPPQAPAPPVKAAPEPAAPVKAAPQPPPTPPQPATSEPPSRSARVSTRGATQAMDDDSQQELCGHNPDLDLGNPGQARGAFYEPDHHLQGLVARALAATGDEPVGLKVLGRTLILLPRQRRCLMTMSDRQLRGLCLMASIGTRDWYRPTPEEISQLEGGEGSSLDTLLWEVALWTARGRLPKGTDPFAPVSLRHWPNLTRLPRPPQALRIAALWSQTPYSPADTARLLAIPQRYVFAFYSGCHSLGLLERHAPALTTAPAPAPVPKAAPRGLLRRILNALRGAA